MSCDEDTRYAYIPIGEMVHKSILVTLVLDRIPFRERPSFLGDMFSCKLVGVGNLPDLLHVYPTSTLTPFHCITGHCNCHRLSCFTLQWRHF